MNSDIGVSRVLQGSAIRHASIRLTRPDELAQGKIVWRVAGP